MENIKTPVTEAQQPGNGQGLDEKQLKVWETNHQKIMVAISEATNGITKNYMPTVSELAGLTGLSRTTVYEHIARSSVHPASKQRNEIFNAVEEEILLKIALKAFKGDLQAAKLYLQLKGKMNNKTSAKNSDQNNYSEQNRFS